MTHRPALKILGLGATRRKGVEELTTTERRTRSLTDEDIRAIIEAMRTNCQNGMSQEDTVELKSFASWLRKLKSAIGNVVIYGVVALLAFLFYLGTGKLRE